MQLLNNLLKLDWRLKNADVTCYMLTSLVSLQHGNIKQSEKLMKIVNLKKKIFISSERVGEFQWNFQQRCDYDNIKSYKKPGLRPFFEKYIFGKTTEGHQINPPSLFRAKKSKPNKPKKILRLNI